MKKAHKVTKIVINKFYSVPFIYNETFIMDINTLLYRLLLMKNKTNND